MNKIKTIARPAEKKVTGCGECRSTCQSACKTSCTVGNQSCERISRENRLQNQLHGRQPVLRAHFEGKQSRKE